MKQLCIAILITISLLAHADDHDKKQPGAGTVRWSGQADSKTFRRVYSRGDDDVAPEKTYETAKMMTEIMTNDTKTDGVRAYVRFAGSISTDEGAAILNTSMFHLREVSRLFVASDGKKELLPVEEAVAVKFTDGKLQKDVDDMMAEFLKTGKRPERYAAGKDQPFMATLNVGPFKKDGKYSGTMVLQGKAPGQKFDDSPDMLRVALKHIVEWSVTVKEGKVVESNTQMSNPRFAATGLLRHVDSYEGTGEKVTRIDGKYEEPFKAR